MKSSRIVPVVVTFLSAVLVPQSSSAEVGGALAELPQHGRAEATASMAINDPLVSRVIGASVEGPSRPLPSEPTIALIDAASAFAAELGLSVDSAPAIRSAGFSNQAAGYLALLVEDLLAAHRATARVLEGRSVEELSTLFAGDRTGTALDHDALGAIRSSAERLYQDAAAAQSVLSSSLCLPIPPPPIPPIFSLNTEAAVWPVFYISRANDIANNYVHDYALTIDCGGSDLYDNNAGGNLLDVQRGPDVPWALQPDTPARGCEQVRELLSAEIAELNCVPSAALVLDFSGNDTYGVRRAGDEVDGTGAQCISDPNNAANHIVRRIVTAGSALAGVGILMDAGGDDQYLGKTVSVGSGHAGGVGILVDTLLDIGDISSDVSSNDSYLAIRNAQGFGLAAGLGLLRDVEGNDTFDHYLLSPDPDNHNGVVSDQNVCDEDPRHLQGVGAFGGGVGVLVNESGADTYRTDTFKAQGFGAPVSGLVGVGVFVDRFGDDDYSQCPAGQCPTPTRDDNTTIPPSTSSFGLFVDTSGP